MKKRRELSARGGRAAKREKGTKRKRIDFSDIPELSEKQLSAMRPVGRPPLGDQPRRLIAIRMDAKVLDWVRKAAMKKRMPYQSLINDILAERMKRAS
jgi:uncharacterized protein (DUF4415 family)